MTTAAARWLAGGLLLLTIAALAISAWFGVANGDLMNAFAFTPLLLAFAVVGAIVASHRPANPIGWLFLAEGLGFALGVATDTYATYATRAGGAAPASVAWAVWLGAILGELGFLFVLAVLLFPDGRLPSRRWRVVAWLIVAGEALVVLMAATSSAALRAQTAAVLVSPVRLIPDSLADPVVNVLQTAFIPLTLAAAAGLAVRYRRATPDVRHQIKWVAYASLLTAVALLIAGLVFGNPLGALLAVGPLIPVAAGIAIFKYRLYDIDVVISKTIVYGSLAAFITLVYVVIVVGIGSLGSGFGRAGSRPDLGLSIVATAVVAVAFQPVRERAQRLANRLVFGKRATPYEALSEFAGRMGGTYATEDALPRMAQVLAEGTAAARAVVWLKDGSELAAGAFWPAGGAPPGRVGFADSEAPAIAGADRVSLVYHQGETLGALSVAKRPGENLTPVEDKLMSDLAAQAGLVLHNIGLTQQLRARLAELQASRLRIVAAARRAAAADRARHPRRRPAAAAGHRRQAGAGASRVAGQDEDRERALVAQLKAETSGALETLRELARGIYPPLLADQGLTAAISAQAGKAPGPVEVDADGRRPLPGGDRNGHLLLLRGGTAERRQACAGVGGPGQPGRGRRAGDVHVTDDGPGFDPATAAGREAGSGLQNMSDRLAALGGSCQVDSSPGRGTTIAGLIGFDAATAGNAGAVPFTGRMG